MAELVSGWSDDRSVYLVFRDGERVSYKKLPARWSFFVRGLDEDDRTQLQRLTDVIGMSQDKDPSVWRIDMRTRWSRAEVARKVSRAVAGHVMFDAFSDDATTEELNAAVLEADVNPLRRLLSDVPHLQIGNPRLGFLDLEVDSRPSVIQQIEGKARILSWALVDSAGELLGAEVLSDDNDDSERGMLERLYVALERVDCVLAWYGSGYDFPVLDKRTMKLKVRVRGKPPVWNRWCWLDQLEVFRKYNQAHESGEERASFKLGDVAKHLIGETKDEFDSSKTWEAWAAGGDERERLLRYNIQDTRMLPRIEDKTGFVALHLAVCQVTRCFPDTDSLGAAMQGDGYMLALGGAQGFRFPSKRAFEEGEEPGAFAGAYVMEPRRTGILDNVHVCDFAGLYPSIIRSWNMSPDTYIAPRDYPRWHGQHARLPDRDVRFRTDVRGLFPIALDALVAQRGEYTKRADAAPVDSEEWHRYKRLSSAFKIVANSFYGIIGSPFTRFFDSTIAEGVTQTGAWLIKKVASTAEQARLEPFYGDTDSVFVQGDRETFGNVVKTLNEGWPSLLTTFGCDRSLVKLDFEKSFRRIVLVSKKRYAGRFDIYKGKPAPNDMKPEIKGLEYKRGDTLRLAREMQEHAIEMLLRDGAAPDHAEMRDYVATWRERVLRGELALEDVMLSQSVKSLSEYKHRYTTPRCSGRPAGKKGKACGYEWGSTDIGKEKEPPKCPKCGTPRKRASLPAHVRVAILMASRGEQVRSGSRIEYLVVLGEDDSDDDKLLAVPARDPGMLERIDRDYYWDSRVLPPTARLLAAAFPGVDWDESASKRRKAAAVVEKAEAKTKNRGRVADLPLFGAMSDRSDTGPAAAPTMPQDAPEQDEPADDEDVSVDAPSAVLDPTAPIFAPSRAPRRGPRPDVMRPQAAGKE